MEKRHFQRIVVLQSATIQGQYSGLIRGEIHDFSEHGVLFNVPLAAPLVDLQDQLVTVNFQSDLSFTTHDFQARVVRVTGTLLGLMVSPFPASAYTALQALAKLAPVAPATVNSPSDSALRQAGLIKTQTIFKQFIRQAIADFYAAIRDVVRADDGRYDASIRSSLSNAYTTVEAQQAKLINAYITDDYLHKNLRDKRINVADNANQLSLVALDVFDEWLVLSTLTTKLSLEYASAIYAFEARYGVLLGQVVNTDENPYSPHYILQTMREVLADAGFQPDLLALLYTLFGEILLTAMAGLYQTLNGVLDYIVLPKKELAPIRRKTLSSTVKHSRLSMGAEPIRHIANTVSLDSFLHDASSSPLGVAAQQAGVQAEVSSDYHLQSLFANTHVPALQSSGDLANFINYLQQLPHTPLAPRPTTTAITGARSVLTGDSLSAVGSAPVSSSDIKQLIYALNNAQISVQNQLPQVSESGIAPWLKEISPHISLNADLWQSVDLFEQLLARPIAQDNASSDIRALLKKMELTLLKLALLDAGFLNSNTHPAQHTVNLLERFYVAADDDGYLFDTQLCQLLNALVNQIVDQFENDTHIFADKNHILIGLITPIEQVRLSNLLKIQSACAQREQWQTMPADGDVNLRQQARLDLLRQGDWLNLSVADKTIAYQIAWLNASASFFVLTNRSATTVQTFTGADLALALLDGQATPVQGYETPFMDRSARKLMFNAYDKVYQQVTHDDLTGLLNRKGLLADLSEACSTYTVASSPIVLCMMIFDQMNQLYTNCDEAEADASVFAIVEKIQATMPATVAFSRLSDNTFAILVYDMDIASVAKLMSGLSNQFLTQRILCQDRQFVMAASIGVAQISDELNTAPKLLRSVSSACAVAKANGNNAVQVYSANSQQIKHEATLFEWAGLIDKVLNENLLFLRCQRIQPIKVSDDALAHYEILLGLDASLSVTTQEFILSAEKWQRSADIDMWVLQHSFDWLAAQGVGLDNISGVSINLSGHTLANEQVLAYIQRRLLSSHVIAQKVIFELTETAFMSNFGAAQQFIQAVRVLGCRFSLDDFGSGYSSFAYLKNLNVDYLKIDGAFVKDLDKSPSDYAMVKAMHEIGSALGLSTIAEYVENAAILAKLKTIGVDYAQGYNIEMPKRLDSLMLST